MAPPSLARDVTPASTAGHLGENLPRLKAIADQCGTNAVFVELGVDRGIVTQTLLTAAEQSGNLVYGVDVNFRHLPYALMAHPCHRRIRSDSVTAGGRWGRGPIDLLFVDTLHVAPHVLCELHVWTPHLRPGGFVIVHDTAWPDDQRDLTWHPRVRTEGASWPTPDQAVASFFGLADAFADGKHTGFQHNDRRITAVHHPASYGMTVVQVHDASTLGEKIDWPAVYRERERVLRLVVGDDGITALRIDLHKPLKRGMA